MESMKGCSFLKNKKQIRIRSEHVTFEKDYTEEAEKNVKKLEELIGTAVYEYYKKNKAKFD